MGKPTLGGGRGKYDQGEFTPRNRDKYIGTYPILCRSSWEKKMCAFLDTHSSVLFWASESLAIPYINPFTKRIANYYPDFMVVFMDKNGNQKREIIEIKPSHETFIEKARTKRDKMAVALNYYKWAAAKKFADSNGLFFRVITEKDIWDMT